MKHVKLFEQYLSEGKNYTEQFIDQEMKDLRAGAEDLDEPMDDGAAFDIADSWISDNPGVEDAIKRLYNVSDVKGWVANHIA
jgi:hypothetical protein